ncbi:5-guanidino-2-oxopentanoate decarboxylase [Labrys sp. La1]|uniref:5-guanidino-2-oxopentanoate decarboxylase n=1 Tax=Labrys sp. La1 TaxID=3404917 RepID=UPI003EBE8214
MSGTSLTTGEYLVRLLESYGVDLIFGIPGVHTVELYRGLPATKIRHVTPRHEQGAGFMADGYARVTGKPGVCFIVTGPGMTNIATAMGQAYADSVPMLVISAVNARDQLAMGQGRLHELPSQRNLVAGVSAFSHTLLDPNQLPEVMARAFTVFNSQRPRPVHIEIPLDIIVAPADHLSTQAWPLPAKASAGVADIEKAAAILKGARRPLIVAGGGAADAAAEITAIAGKLDAPVFTTINGRGILEPGHPLALNGNLGMAPLLAELAASDAILAIGTEFGETEMYPEPQTLKFGGPLIRIDIDPLQLAAGLRCDLPIAADAKLAAAALLAALGEGRPIGDGEARAKAVRAKVEEGLWPACRTHARLMEIVTKALPEAVVAGDQTEPVYAVNQFYQAPQPRSYFNSSTGYGTLGYGLPAAFGAKLGAPNRPSVCLIGDGGLQFSLQELASAVEAKIAAVVIIWNNTSYGEIKAFMAERDIPQIGVDIFTPDFVGLSRALGCTAALPASIEELTQELAASTTRDVPTVIEIRAGSALASALAQ